MILRVWICFRTSNGKSEIQGSFDSALRAFAQDDGVKLATTKEEADPSLRSG
jgi:hypothetical protein